MPKAKKLPSGNWRVLLYIGKDETGKRIYKSFTDKDKRKALNDATTYLVSRKDANNYPKFLKAMKEYIELKRQVLSPSTIKSYIAISKRLDKYYSSFIDKELDKITNEDIQKVINDLSTTSKPKTVRNYSGFIHSVLDSKGIILKKWTLPQKIKPILNIPESETIKKVLEIAKDSEIYIPLVLAVTGPMRRGEIAALTIDDIKGNIIHVHKSMVMGDDNKYYIKAPKTYASDRYIELPTAVIEKIKEQGYVTKLNPNQISLRFNRLLAKHNIKHFRFHDIRHYSASILHALGIPDSYIMTRGGWTTDNVLKNIYRHTLEEENKKVTEKANNHFSSLF